MEALRYEYDYKQLMNLIQGFTDRCAAIGPNGEKSCSVVFTYMKPDDFLSHVVSPDCYSTGDKAPKCSFDEERVEELKDKMMHFKALDVPYLDLTSCERVKVWKPYQIPTVARDFPKEKWREYYAEWKEPLPRTEYCAHHEGRHRAVAARELGIDLPVVLMVPKNTIERCVVRR